MQPPVSYVSQGQDPTIHGLPLQVERPVLGVRQYVVHVIAAKQVRARPTFESHDIGQKLGDGLRVGRGRRGCTAEGIGERAGRCGRELGNKGQGESYTKGAIKSAARTGRELTEELTPVIVDAKTGAHDKILDEGWAPCRTNARPKPPLPPLHGRVADALGSHSRVAARNHNATVYDGVGGRIVLVAAGVKVCQQAVFLCQRAVPVIAQPETEGQVPASLETVLDISANLL